MKKSLPLKSGKLNVCIIGECKKLPEFIFSIREIFNFKFISIYRPLLVLLLVLFIFNYPAHAVNKTWVGSSGSNWSATSSWSPSGVPTTNDTVIFGTSVIVDVDVSASVQKLIVTGTASPILWADGASRTITLTFGGNAFNIPSGATLTVAGDDNGSGRTLTIAFSTVGSTSTIAGRLNLEEENAAGIYNGANCTTTVSGILDIDDGSYNYSAAGTTIISGTGYTDNGGTFTCANGTTTVSSTGVFNHQDGSLSCTSGTFTVHGIFNHYEEDASITSTSSNFIIGPTGFYHLRNGIAIATAGWQSGSTCEINSTEGGTLTGVNQSFHHFNVNKTSSSNEWSCGGLLTSIGGNFTILATGSGSAEFRLSTSTSSNYTLNVGGSLITVGGILSMRDASSGSSTSTLIVAGNFVVSGGAVDMNSGSSSGANSIHVAGDLHISSPGVLRSTQVSSTRTLLFNKASGTQTFNSSAGGINTHNIQFNVGTGTSTNTLLLNTNCIIHNSATLTVAANAILDCQTNTLTATTISNSGIIRTSNTSSTPLPTGRTWGGIVEYYGASQTIVNGTYNSLNVNQSSGNATLGGLVNVNGTLLFSSGKIVTNANKITLGNSAAVSNANSSRYVFGNLEWNLPGTGSVTRTFDIGDASVYAPAVVSFNLLSAGGTLLGKTTPNDHPNIGTSGITNLLSVNRYWTFTNNGIGFSTYDLTLNFDAGDVDAGANPGNFIIKRYNSPSWNTTVAGLLTATSTEAIGITSFSDFQIGEGCLAPSLSSPVITNLICNGGNDGAVSITTSGGSAPLSYSWSPGGATTQNISGITANTYTVTVTSNGGCSATETANVTEPGALSASFINPAVCAQTPITDLYVSLAGGTAPLSYEYFDGSNIYTITSSANTDTIHAPVPGFDQYVLFSVSDINGCSGTILNPEAVILSIPVVDISGDTTICEDASAIIHFNGTPNTTVTYTINGGPNQTINIPASGNVDLNTGPLTANSTFTTISVGYTTGPGCDTLISESVIATVLPNSSSNFSDTSCDSYVLPWGTTVTTSGIYVHVYPSANGCDSTVTADITVNYSTPSSVTVSTCDSYTWAGNTYTTSGTYYSVNTNVGGCDSTVTLNLTINYSYLLVTTVDTCDSYVWHGTTYTATGIYSFSNLNVGGCDSTVTLDLTIGYSNTSTTTVTACDSYVWNGNTYTNSTTSTFTTTNAAGCDSVATLILTIRRSTSSAFSAVECDSLLLPWGVWVYSTGIYTHNYVAANGCDSVVSANITINLSQSHYFTAVGCDSYTLPWGGTVTTSGIYQNIYTLLNGCDSIVTANVTIDYNSSSTYNASSCDTLFLPWGDTALTSNSYSHLYFTEYGCDSLVTFVVEINRSTSSFYSDAGCDSLFLPWGDTALVTGEYQHIYTAANGCDSIVTALITIHNSTIYSYSQTACDSLTLPWGQFVTISDNYTHTYQSIYGCDSVVTAQITINSSSSSTFQDTSCDSLLLPWGDYAYTSGNYSHTYSTALNCDSIVTAEVTIKYSASSTANITICAGQSYTPPGGTSQTTSGIYVTHISTTEGCDSTITTVLTVLNPIIVTATPSAIICNGGTSSVSVSAVGGTGTYVTGTGVFTGYAAGQYTFTVTDDLGCTGSATITISEPPALSMGQCVSTDALCNGASTGSVGAGPVNNIVGSIVYTWTNSSNNIVGTTAIVTGLPADTYTLTVSDDCSTLNCTVIVGEPPAMTMTPCSSTNAICNSGGGSVTAGTISNSIGNIIYTWRNSSNVIVGSTSSIVGLQAGTYTLTVNDNCSSLICSVTITQPQALSMNSCSHTNATCFGVSDGSVSAGSVSNAVGTVNYTWTNSSSIVVGNSPSVSGLPADTYTLVVTDDCFTLICTQTVTEPAQLSMSACTQTNALCNGANSGSVSAGVVTNFVGTVMYEWRNSSNQIVGTTPAVSGLPADTYVLTVTDNCSLVSCTVIVGAPAALSMTSCSSTDAACFGGAGSVTAGTVSNAVGLVVYTWRNSSNLIIGNMPSISGLIAGTYTLTVSDNCSSVTCSVTINQPPALSMTPCSHEDALCNGTNSGSVSAGIVSNAVGAVNYIWQNSSNVIVGTSSTVTNLPAGSYTLTVSDNCFTLICTQTISQPSALVMAACTKIDATCYGSSTGSVSAGAINYSIGAITYSWTNSSNVIVGNTPTVNNLPADTYTLLVTDSCSSVSCIVIINEPPALNMTACTFTDALCNGSNSGTVSAGFVSNVIGVINYSWTNSSNVVVGTTATVNNLPADTYTLTVSDDCSFLVCSVTVNEPGALAMTGCTHTDAVCFGSGGSVSAGTVSNFVGTLLYTWRNSINVIVGNTPTVSGLPAGTYTLTVTDNCSAVYCTETISQPPLLSMTACSHTDAICNGSSTGSVTAGIVSNNVGTIVYTWTNSGGIPVGSGTTVTGLPAGTYTLTVEDDCSFITCTQTIGEPLSLSMAGCSVIIPLCNGGTGTVTAGFIINNVGSVNYVWKNSSNTTVGTTASVSGLPAGVYTLTASDDCFSATCIQVITEPAALQMSACTHIDAVCFGGTGSVSAGFVTNSVGPVDYSWTNSSNVVVGTSPTVTGLAAGTYTLTVNDQCSVIICSQTINEPSALTMTPCSHLDAPCHGGTGVLLAGTVSNSNGAINYIWKNSSNVLVGTTALVTGVPADTYTLTVTDNCSSITCTETITEPASLSMTPCTYTNVSCAGGSDGSLTAGSVSNIVGSIQYTWTNSSNQVIGAGTSVVGVPSGTYTLTVSDDCGFITCSQTIIHTGGIIMNACSHVDATCFGGTGSVSAGTVTNANGPVNYIWKNSANNVVGTSATVTGLPAGTYTLTVSDNCGPVICSQTINQPTPVSVAIGVTATGCAVNNGIATANPSGGNPGYTYSWTPGGATTQSIIGLAVGNYSVTVTDINGCTGTATSTIAVAGGPPANPGTIIGPSGGCRNQTGVVYSVVPVAGATSYIWTLPSGISGSSTGASITVNFSSSYSTSNICVRAVNACGQSGNMCMTIPRLTVIPSRPAAINGPVNLCPNSSATYSVVPVAGATSYIWVVDPGMTIVSGAGTNSIIVSAASGFIKGEITVRSSNCQGNSSRRRLTVNGVPSTPIWKVSPPAIACGGSCYYFNVDNVQDAISWTYTAPAGCVITSGSAGPGNPITTTTSNAYICFPPGFVSGTITIVANNGCGQSAPLTYTVGSVPQQPGPISGPSPVCRSLTNVLYQVASVPTATSYTWSVTGGAQIRSGQGTRSARVRFNTASSTTVVLSVRANNSCGQSVVMSRTISVNFSCRISEQETELESMSDAFNLDAVSVYPNPTSGRVSISFNTTRPVKVSLSVSNLIGKIMKSEILSGVEGQNIKELNLEDFAKGIYLISLRTDEGELKTLRLVVE